MSHTETNKRHDYVYFYLIDKKGRKHYREGHLDDAEHIAITALEENANKGWQGVYVYNINSGVWDKLCYYNSL